MRDDVGIVPYEGFAITLSFRAERSAVEKSQPRMRSLHFGRDDRVQVDSALAEDGEGSVSSC